MPQQTTYFPSVSVIMSVFNGEQFIRDAVNSVLSQTFRDFEFIIIDDGSTDGTAAIIESFDDSRITVVHQRNFGLTKSLNIALSMAKGEFIARQDADDLSIPNRLETQLAFLRENPEISLVGSSVKVIDAEGSELAVFNPPCDAPTIRQKLKSYNCLWHGSVLFRRSCLSVLGGYNEKFTTAQDYDLWLRFAENFELANLSTPLYAYRFNPEAVTFKKIVSQRRMAQMARALGEARNQNLSEQELLQGFAAFIAAPLTDSERTDIVQSYKPWCRLLLKNDKLREARSLMAAVFKYHPSRLFRLRFYITRNLASKPDLERILDHA